MDDSVSARGVGAPEAHLRFRADIEGLRAVAIVFVVLYHAGWHRMPGGFLGVDVFFVLSGFLISALLIEEVARTGRISLLRFWARRARRLLPAAAFITGVVLVANAVLLSPFEQIAHAATAQAFAAYGSNILFAIRSTDYFAGAASHDPLLHTWSLSVEEQFYLLFAPMLLVLSIWTIKRPGQAFRRWLWAGVTGFSVASLVGCLLLVRHFPVIAFYALPTRAWEFGLGVITALIVRKVDGVRHEYLEVTALVGAAALLASAALVTTEPGQSLGWVALVPTVAAAFLIFSGASTAPTLVARGLSTAGFRLVGRLSYSWYLWHWPILVYLHEVRPAASTRLSVAVAVLALIPSVITYRLVESPIRFSRRLQQHPGYAVAGALLLSALTFGLAAAAIRHANATLDTPPFSAIRAAMDSSVVYANGCQVSLLAVNSPPCRFGPGRNDTTVVLFGDSHAAQWFPAMDSVAALRGWTLVNLTKTGCPSVSVAVMNAALARRYTECETWRAVTIARIIMLRPAIVIVSNATAYSVIVGDQVRRTDSTEAGRDAWGNGLATSFDALRPSGARVILIHDTPRLPFAAPRCLAKHLSDPDRCVVPIGQAIDTAMYRTERAAVTAANDVRDISLDTAICGPTTCLAEEHGVVHFRDSNHLTVRYSRSLAPILSNAISGTLAGAP